MDLGNKIDKIRNNLSYIEFSKAIAQKTGHEISPSSLHKYTTNQRNPSYKMLEIIATYGDVPITFFFDKGNPLYEKVKRLDKLKKLNKDYSDLKMIKEIPILGQVPAGEPNSHPEIFEGNYPLPMSIYNNESFALRIKGDSMLDVGIEHGDLVLVRKQSTAEMGQTIIARIGDEVTCKRFYIKNGLPVLEPANLKYKTIEPRELEIVGIVTKIIKELE